MKYAHILSRLYNTPLAISQCKLDVITSNVTMKLLANEQVGSLDQPPSLKTNYASNVINIFDALVSKNGAGDSGTTSYESITRQVQRAITDGYKTIYFYLDTPGGEVAGLFGLANFIASLPSKYGVTTIGFTDGMAASAGYVLLSAVQKAYATESSILGSIGVIMTLVNAMEADKKAGMEYTILRSKDEKALLNPHEAPTDQALADAVSKLKLLDTVMNDSIMKNRPMVTLQTILDLNGKTVLAEEALKLGLIDGIASSIDEIVNTSAGSNINFKKSTSNLGAKMTLEELQAEVIKLTAENATLKADLALSSGKAVEEERARILGVMDAGTTTSMPINAVLTQVKSGASVEASMTMFTTIKELTQGTTQNIDTSGQGDRSSINGKVIPNGKQEDISAIGSLMSGLDSLKNEPMQWR